MYNEQNSKIVSNNSLGFSLKVRVPADYETFDAIFGKDAALNLAVTHVLYHVWNGQFREAFADALSERTGIAIPTEDGTEDGKPISETKFLAYVLAQKDGDGKPVISTADLNALAQEVAGTLTDLKPRESTRGTGNRTKEVKEAGARIFASIQSGERSLEDFVAKWEAANPGKVFASLGDATDVSTFIDAVHINSLRIAAEIKRQQQEAMAGL